MTTANTHIVLLDQDGSGFVGLAKTRARQLYARLEATGQQFGAQRFEVSERDKTFYIEISITRPFVRIHIDSKGCPSYVSGLVWVKDYLAPTVTVDEIEYLRTLFPKATPTVEEDSARLAGNAAQIRTVRPSMYSGEMRKVVQVLQGQGKEIAYNYRATETHGVFRTAGGTPWVIKVSRSGVHAWLMNVCRGRNTPEGLGYTPLLSPEPEEPRELLGADAMEAVYEGKGGFYGGCGWAFSASGAKAANCFVGSQDMYSYSWQYQISIQADNAGNPASASVAVLAEGYIHGPKTTHMKFPRNDNPLALFSFDPYRGNANYVNDCAAPVFCFFDREVLQTYFYLYAPSASFSRTDDGFAGKPSICTEFENEIVYNGSYSETAIPTIQLNSTRAESSVSDNRRTFLMRLEGPLGMGFFANEIGGIVREVWWRIFERQSERNAVNNQRTSVLIVTGHDREAAYLAEREVNSHGDYEYSLQRNGISKFNYTKTDSVPCDATGSLGAISTVVAANSGPTWTGVDCDSGVRYAELTALWVSPGSGAGSTIQWAQQLGFVPGWNGCLSTYEADWLFVSANTSDVKEVLVTFPGRTTVDYRLSLVASGGMRAAVDASDAEIGEWMQFIDLGVSDQTASVVRDAFFPTRCAYTRAVNNIRGKDLITAPGFGPYDLSAVTGATLSFVGVP